MSKNHQRTAEDLGDGPWGFLWPLELTWKPSNEGRVLSPSASVGFFSSSSATSLESGGNEGGVETMGPRMLPMDILRPRRTLPPLSDMPSVRCPEETSSSIGSSVSSSSSSGGLGGIRAGNFLATLDMPEALAVLSMSCCCSGASLVHFSSPFLLSSASVIFDGGGGSRRPDTRMDCLLRNGGGGGDTIFILPENLSYLA